MSEDFLWDGHLNPDQTIEFLKNHHPALKPDPSLTPLTHIKILSQKREGEEMLVTIRMTIRPQNEPQERECQFTLRRAGQYWKIRRWDGGILDALGGK